MKEVVPFITHHSISESVTGSDFESCRYWWAKKSKEWIQHLLIVNCHTLL